MIRAAALGAALVCAVFARAGPVDVYRTGPEFCPHDRPVDAPVLTEAQAVDRARALVPHDFCGPNRWVSGCDSITEWANGAWQIFLQQYRDARDGRDYGGLDHTYVILDRVGNCLANIPGTELGARN